MLTRHSYVPIIFNAWCDYVSRQVEIKRKAAFAIGPGRLLNMCFRAWQNFTRESVKQAERDWVRDHHGSHTHAQCPAHSPLHACVHCLFVSLWCHAPLTVCG